jgi:xanthine dehydrogenase iron-sulfur cluster and FAD-binding subunit A
VTKTFDYKSVRSVEEACALLAEYGSDARLLAGGTDLLVEFRRPQTKIPKLLIDISRVAELRGIVGSENSVAVGPLTTHEQLVRSGVLAEAAPLLASAAITVGSPQIRNLGTIGGNVMNAAACADTVPPLIALGATVVLQSSSGTRSVPLKELFLKPYETVARPNEFLIRIEFPKLLPGVRSAFIKLGRRNALSISRLSVAAIIQQGSDGRIIDARIVPGAAFPTWLRVGKAEQMLLGEIPSKSLFAAVGKRVSEMMIECTGRRWSTEYKEPVLAILVRRALEQCIAPVERLSMKVNGCAEVAERKIPVAVTQSVQQECSIKVTINRRVHTLRVPARRTLLELLRTDLGLTGTKCGCEVGECGACTVLLDGRAVNSCLVLAPQIDGREVLTVEGLMNNGKLHPLQESFMDHDAAHCGFCTPGMLMSAKALLDERAQPDEQEIRTAISGNLCRCTGYMQIVEAIGKTGTLVHPNH